MSMTGISRMGGLGRPIKWPWQVAAAGRALYGVALIALGVLWGPRLAAGYVTAMVALGVMQLVLAVVGAQYRDHVGKRERLMNMVTVVGIGLTFGALAVLIVLRRAGAFESAFLVPMAFGVMFMLDLIGPESDRRLPRYLISSLAGGAMAAATTLGVAAVVL